MRCARTHIHTLTLHKRSHGARVHSRDMHTRNIRAQQRHSKGTAKARGGSSDLEVPVGTEEVLRRGPGFELCHEPGNVRHWGERGGGGRDAEEGRREEGEEGRRVEGEACRGGGGRGGGQRSCASHKGL
jgi:hypothetical protein